METFTQLFGDLLAFVYHCFDRIVIYGYLSGLSRPEQVVGRAPPLTKGDMEIHQQRRALAAMEEIRDCIERRRKPPLIRCCTPHTFALDESQIRGDDYMRELIENLERGRERQQDYSRTREQ